MERCPPSLARMVADGVVNCGLVASGACAGALLRYGVHDVAKSRAADVLVVSALQ